MELRANTTSLRHGMKQAAKVLRQFVGRNTELRIGGSTVRNDDQPPIAVEEWRPIPPTGWPMHRFLDRLRNK